MALKTKKTDAGLNNTMIAEMYANKDSEIAVFPEPLKEAQFGFGFSKTYEDTAKWQSALDSIPKEDLDAICPDAEIVILEGEAHSVWVNSRTLARHGVTDDVVDPVPGLSYYVRKDGHVTGNVFEGRSPGLKR